MLVAKLERAQVFGIDVFGLVGIVSRSIFGRERPGRTRPSRRIMLDRGRLHSRLNSVGGVRISEVFRDRAEGIGGFVEWHLIGTMFPWVTARDGRSCDRFFFRGRIAIQTEERSGRIDISCSECARATECTHATECAPATVCTRAAEFARGTECALATKCARAAVTG